MLLKLVFQVKGRQVPLELKSGRTTFSAEHKGQVTIYSMMMKNEVEYKIKNRDDHFGLLLYLSDGVIKGVQHGLEEQQGNFQFFFKLPNFQFS